MDRSYDFQVDGIEFSYSISDETIFVKNNTSSSILKVWFIDVDTNYCPRPVDSLGKKGWVAVKTEQNKLWRVYISTNHFQFYIYDCIVEDSKLVIKDITKNNDYNFDKEIVFVTGSSGGGTSIVAKALRVCGIHFGDDCGNISNRKSHESVTFRLFVRSLSTDTTVFDARNSFNKISNVYGYKKDFVNCTKIVNIQDISILLGDIFPKCKFLSICRTQNNFFSTREGKAFHELPELELLKRQRYIIEGHPVFHLDFDKFFTDFHYFNKVLSYLGSTNVLNSSEDLDKLKLQINFNSDILS